MSVRASRSDGFFVLGCIYPDRVILHGTIQQTPEHGAKSDTGQQFDDIHTEANIYADAHQALTASIPDGWRLIAIRRD